MKIQAKPESSVAFRFVYILRSRAKGIPALRAQSSMWHHGSWRITQFWVVKYWLMCQMITSDEHIPNCFTSRSDSQHEPKRFLNFLHFFLGTHCLLFLKHFRVISRKGPAGWKTQRMLCCQSLQIMSRKAWQKNNLFRMCMLCYASRLEVKCRVFIAWTCTKPVFPMLPPDRDRTPCRVWEATLTHCSRFVFARFTKHCCMSRQRWRVCTEFQCKVDVAWVLCNNVE